jgi:hypothetical protein
MRRLLSLLLIAILSAMPLTGIAKQASADATDTQEMQDMKDMPCHQSTPKPAADSTTDCDSCASASLCCAVFLPPAAAFLPSDEAEAIRIAGASDLPAGIVVPPLEPPPLAT